MAYNQSRDNEYTKVKDVTTGDPTPLQGTGGAAHVTLANSGIVAAGNNYIGYGYIAAGGAGVFGFIQLFNPASSGITVEITRIFVPQSASSNMVGFGYYDTQMPTAVTGGISNMDTRSANTPTAVMQAESTATQRLPEASQIITVGRSVNNHAEIVFPYPIILGEGKGIVGRTTGGNLRCDVGYEWREVAI